MKPTTRYRKYFYDLLYIWMKTSRALVNSVRETTSTVVVVFDSYGYLPLFLENESGIVSLAVAWLAG